ncbi:DUF2993 domain-containing protein [Hoyosella sp. G463]|uniref:DUF2993 domain-containing protein n=1 Tax=Lolliginicoccus lacisalsi TaxID=2742202 RepID=A0A927PLL7_9ACTN|nr:LmeA family phospholipid-binding protein [Lolliginicoccus lacisalsi]MBD8505954.1 DUF2993 domain-containing protein [Lolliginicoccus lacisalsi]
MNTATNSPRPRRRRARGTALIVVIVLFVGVAAVAVGSEIYLRNKVSRCMAGSMALSIGSDVDVELSRKPMLWQMLDGKTPYMEVTTTEGRVGDAEGMSMNLRLEDVESLDEGEIANTVQSSSADIAWSAQGILATLQKQGILAVVTSVNPDQQNQALDIQVVGAVLGVTVQPRVVDEAINLEVTKANIFGIDIPSELPQAIISTIGAELSDFPLGMTPRELTVTEEGIDLRLEGGYAEIERADASDTEVPAELEEACSLL